MVAGKENAFNVKDYLSEYQNHSGRLKVIERELKGLENLTLPSEKLIKNKIKKELVDEKINLSYRKLDLSFLELGQKKDEITVPKFGVYSLRDPSCEINIKNSVREEPGMGFILGAALGVMGGLVGGAFAEENLANPELGFLIGGCIPLAIGITKDIWSHFTTPYEKEIEFTNTPRIFNSHLIKSLDFHNFTKPNYHFGNNKYYFRESKIPQELNRKYKRLGSIGLTSKLNCLVPEKTKNYIEIAKPLFGEEIYFIRELKQEEWNVGKPIIVEEDPLVVGIKSNQAYFIDSFDPTPLERYFSKKDLTKN